MVVINPLRIWASGYRAFDELPPLDIPLGCTGIVGSNGAGKSSLVNVIDIALFAEPGELGGDDVLSTDHDQLEVGLEFEHAGETYRVRRQLRRGKSATLDLEVMRPLGAHDEAEHWHSLTREKVAETSKLICETIGLTRQSFRASAFMRQNDGGAFAQAAAKDRKEMLGGMLMLGRWEPRREQCALEARALEADLVKLDSQAELAEHAAAQRTELETGIARLRDSETQGVDLVAKFETLLETAQKSLAEHAAGKERIRACEAELATARADEHRARDLLLEAQQAKVAADGKQALLDETVLLAARVPEFEQQLEAQRTAQAAAIAAEGRRREVQLTGTQLNERHRRLTGERDQTLAAIASLIRRIDHLRNADDEQRCDRCEQILGEQAKAAALASMAAELEQLYVDEAAKNAELAETSDEAKAVEELLGAIVVPPVPEGDFETKLARARDARTRSSALAQLIGDSFVKVAQLPLLETELTQLTAVTAAKQTALDETAKAAGDTTAIEQTITGLRAELARARALLDETRKAIAKQEGLLEQVAAAEQQLAEIQVKRSELGNQLDVFKLGEKAFGRDGVPALLVEAVAVPQIEAEANRVLEQLPMADGRVFRVELQTQSANKSNDNVRETLDIVVCDRDARRKYESFSGGEKMRINLALRRALAQLLAHRRGAETRFLVIDEPDGLDTTAMQALPEILEQLIVAGELDRILIVSHQDELATAFEQSITVSIESGRSRVDAGALEAVSA